MNRYEPDCSERNWQIFVSNAGGATYGELGAEHGISRERVRQIVESCERSMGVWRPIKKRPRRPTELVHYNLDTGAVLNGDILEPGPPRRRRAVDPMIYYVETRPGGYYEATWSSYVVYSAEAACR